MSRWYGDCVYGEELYKGIPLTPEGTVNLFAWEPNWANGVQVKYRYNTIISRTRLLKEQRKPLLSSPLRTLRFSVLDDDPVFSAKLEHYLKKYHAKQVLVPIYTEPVLVDSSRHDETIDGFTSVRVNSRIANCYNFINLSLVCLFIDIKYSLKAELKTIQQIYQVDGEWTLLLSSVIQTAFRSNRTVIYPLFEAVLESKRLEDHTDTVTDFDCEFKEVFLYGV